MLIKNETEIKMYEMEYIRFTHTHTQINFNRKNILLAILSNECAELSHTQCNVTQRCKT